MKPVTHSRKTALAMAASLLVCVPGARAVNLEECIHGALQSSPDVCAATERVQAARAAAREARSATTRCSAAPPRMHARTTRPRRS